MVTLLPIDVVVSVKPLKAGEVYYGENPVNDYIHGLRGGVTHLLDGGTPPAGGIDRPLATLPLDSPQAEQFGPLTGSEGKVGGGGEGGGGGGGGGGVVAGWGFNPDQNSGVCRMKTDSLHVPIAMLFPLVYGARLAPWIMFPLVYGTHLAPWILPLV
jgi:hypothetical protein